MPVRRLFYSPGLLSVLDAAKQPVTLNKALQIESAYARYKRAYEELNLATARLEVALQTTDKEHAKILDWLSYLSPEDLLAHIAKSWAIGEIYFSRTGEEG